MTKRIGMVFLLLIACGVAASNVFAINDSFFTNKGVGVTPVGKKAWDFTLPTVKDKAFNLSKSISGKKAIIFFGTTWCPYCRKQFAKINSLYKELTKNKIVVVFINPGESKVAVKRYLDRNRYDFDVVMDYKESLGELYPFAGIPALFFVDEKGFIKFLFYDLPENYQKYF